MQLPFPCNDKGATQTETTLRVASHARVFALGDVSTMDPSGSTPSPQLPPTAQVSSHVHLVFFGSVTVPADMRVMLPMRGTA